MGMQRQGPGRICGGTWHIHEWTNGEDVVLASWRGVCNDLLQALWSLRSSSIGPESLSNLIEEARIMSTDIDQATARCNRISNDTNRIQSDRDVGLKPLVYSAVDGISNLG